MEVFLWKKGETINFMEIVKLAKKGNKEAFQKLIRENKTSMYRIAKTILSNEADIEDAISESIMKAYKNMDKLKKDKYFKTWLFKILINECNYIHRKRSREVLDESAFEHLSCFDKHEDLTLKEAVDSLEENLRTLVVLFYYEDLNIKQISSLMDIPEGTIKTRLSRARNKLYHMLKEDNINE